MIRWTTIVVVAMLLPQLSYAQIDAAALARSQRNNGGTDIYGNEQAASFAAYVTGKTAAEVAGIAVSEGKPADADLSSSVTIAIGDFQKLIAKALA